MRFILTPHARERMIQRGVTISSIKEVVNNDGKTKTSVSVTVRKTSTGMTKQGRNLKVIYEIPAHNKAAGKIIIITVIWR